MDTYAPFVWTSYGIVFGLLGAMSVIIAIRLNRAKNRLLDLQSEELE